MRAEYEERKMFVNSYDRGEMRSTLEQQQRLLYTRQL